MSKELLPIGSVVQLANSTGLVMVAGYLPVVPSRPDHVWDYSGFQFPLGYTSNDTVYCFDHEQIQVVYAYGYRDIEQDIFMSKLDKAAERAEELVKAGGVNLGGAPEKTEGEG